jgi:hypothetical protein
MPYLGTSPASELANLDINGQKFILDADGDTHITADTDDQIDISIAGADDFQFTANTFTAQSGSTIAAQALTATGVTVTGNVTITGGVIFDDETLDIYDEGTWTPILRPYTTAFDSVTYNGIYYGRYVIIGHICHFEFSIRTDAITKGSGSGDMNVWGLPVAPVTLSNHYRQYPIKAIGPFDGEFPSVFLVGGGNTFGSLTYNADTTTASSNTNIADIGTGANENWFSSVGHYGTN